MPFAALIPLIVAGAQAVASGIAAHKQAKENRKLAQFQADANQQNIDAQNAYNSPKAQMARFQEANLNPNLIYGQGTPGNQASAAQYPDIKPANYQEVGANLSTTFNQASLMQAQVGAINAKTVQTHALTEVNKMQAKLIAANPLLNDEGFKATIDGLTGTAMLKMSQNQGQIIQNQVSAMSAGHQVNKVFHEVELLEQKFRLGQADAQIKAQILKSAEFKNAILEVQKKFMTDGDITPQHILQFVMLLLTKSF